MPSRRSRKRPSLIAFGAIGVVLLIRALGATFVIVFSGGSSVPDESREEAHEVILRLATDLLGAQAAELQGTRAEGARDLLDQTDEYIEAVKTRRSIVGEAEALGLFEAFHHGRRGRPGARDHVVLGMRAASARGCRRGSGRIAMRACLSLAWPLNGRLRLFGCAVTSSL